MTTSLDRKLARCAREIEEAKPKVMSLSDFESLHHAFPDGTFKIKGAAQEPGAPVVQSIAPPTPVAAPPSTEKPPKFAVGQVWRTRDMGLVTITVVDCICGDPIGAQHDCGMFWYQADGTNGGEYRDWDLVELVQPSEPKEADGWVAYKPGDEVPEGRCSFQIRWNDGTELNYPRSDLRASMRSWDTNTVSKVRAYRLVKQQ